MGSSAAGLTATIIKDEATRSYILEAGALPLANSIVIKVFSALCLLNWKISRKISRNKQG